MTNDTATEMSPTPAPTAGFGWGRILLWGTGVLGVLALYLLFWPVPIDPYAWEPAPDPGRTGPYLSNQDLDAAHPNLLIGYEGPEDVAIGPLAWSYPEGRGWLFSGVVTGGDDHRGLIVRIDPETIAADETKPPRDVIVEEYFETGGRPLGLDFDDQGVLYVADAIVGPLRLERKRDGEIVRSVLPPPPGSEPITYTDSVRVGPDGKVWYTSPSARWELEDIRLDGMETRPTGRLISYDPDTGTSRLEIDELMFANGVAHEETGKFVLVAEWSRYRILRKWLEGPRAGEVDIFFDNLPGYPDNISWDPEASVFWVGLVIPRSPVVDRLHPYPFWMKVLPRIPEVLQPQLPNIGWLVGIDVEGRIHRNSQDFEGKIQRVTGARHLRNDQLVLTSDFAGGIAIFSVPRAPTLALETPVHGDQL